MGLRAKNEDKVREEQKPRGPPLDPGILNAFLNRCQRNYKKDPTWYSKFKAGAKYVMGKYRPKPQPKGVQERVYQNDGQGGESVADRDAELLADGDDQRMAGRGGQISPGRSGQETTVVPAHTSYVDTFDSQNLEKVPTKFLPS
ncbi:hypothetical protein QAD02_021540 [Eretmocerus hayati]|uniref:Uncharacterized protein n=1 Tax=Eretmocerus hayati TaxID=131215 RepID=A0ACC2PQQ5_9HYME|nr:hypothetical protein QAD02_021540 [Eretmocerus hayati]